MHEIRVRRCSSHLLLFSCLPSFCFLHNLTFSCSLNSSSHHLSPVLMTSGITVVGQNKHQMLTPTLPDISVSGLMNGRQVTASEQMIMVKITLISVFFFMKKGVQEEEERISRIHSFDFIHLLTLISLSFFFSFCFVVFKSPHPPPLSPVFPLI